MSQDPEWKDPPPPGSGMRGVWMEILRPLTKHPGRWARIHVADEPELAQHTVSNLNRRLVQIPYPDASWEFVARGCEVYGRFYRGRKTANAKPVRRTKRAG